MDYKIRQSLLFTEWTYIGWEPDFSIPTGYHVKPNHRQDAGWIGAAKQLSAALWQKIDGVNTFVFLQLIFVLRGYHIQKNSIKALDLNRKTAFKS